MAHDVFISYSAEDKPTADAVCAALEARNVRCWIAPRDVLPGRDYAEMLIEGIRDTSLMVLVFSSNSNRSAHVMREVERAASRGMPILPFRIESVPPCASMEYYISSTHWLDALTPPLESHLERLADTAQRLLTRSGRVAAQADGIGALLPTADAPTAAGVHAAPLAGAAHGAPDVAPDLQAVPAGVAEEDRAPRKAVQYDLASVAGARPWWRRPLALIGMSVAALAVVAAAVVIPLLYGGRQDDSVDGRDSGSAATASSVSSATTMLTSSSTAAATGLTSSTAATVAPSSTATTMATAAPGRAVWTDLRPAGDAPSARGSACAACDSEAGTMILFGGWDGSNRFDQTWAYASAGNVWAELSPAGDSPPARDAHCMAWDSNAGQAIIFGGWNGDTCVNDMWSYDPATNAWTGLDPTGTAPSARGWTSLVYIPQSGELVLFGGWDDAVHHADTWAFDPAANAWTRLHPGGGLPSARSHHAMVCDTSTGKVIMFGGSDGSRCLDDTWSYDPATNAWTELQPVGESPPARNAHKMVFNPATGTVLLFGGWDGFTCHGDTWAYDPIANTWAQLHPAGILPSERAAHSMVYDPTTGMVLLFGGWDGSEYLDGTWTFVE